jgi:RNA polymerase sigma-70 factor (ECF subfamily)
MDDNWEHLIQLPAITDEAGFERVFKTYFKSLHAYACTITKEEAAAEEVVQQVFVKLWERSEGLTISGSVAAYLYRAVYNESLNYLKHRKVRAVHQQYVEHSMKNVNEQAGKKLSLKELEGRLAQALNDLPEQCRTIFQMSRFEELRYKEIADRLGISVKTVENQMGKALKLLRVKLVEFLPLIILGLLEIIKTIS